MSIKSYLFPFTILGISLFLATNSSANELVDNKNGTVTDNATGLTWQATDDNMPREWKAALKYCQDLTLAGYDDWRLPNHYNLRTISHKSSTYPAIDQSMFPQTKAAKYWSSTYLPYYDKMAYFVNFGKIDISRSKELRLQDMEMKNLYYVRCVRGKRKKSANKKTPVTKK
jgi:hypothetical protein